MHIQELENGRIDTETFWFEGVKDGDDMTVLAGRRYWSLAEDLADTYPCPTCKPSAMALAHGGHDMINIIVKDANPVTPELFEALHDLMEEAWKKYKGKLRHDLKHDTLTVTHG